VATGISISSTSNLDSGQKILVAKARDAFEPAAPDPDLIEVERIPQGHKQWDMSRYARLSDASALTEGVDLAQAEQLVTNSVTITPSEHGILAIISKRLQRRQGDSNVYAKTGTLLGNSLRRRMAKDVIALYDGFSKSVVGAGTALDITYFRGSVAYLLTDNSSSYGPAPLPLRAALHIEQISDIMLDLTDSTGTSTGVAPFSGGLSDELVQNWWRGSDRLYGVQVFHSGLIERDSGDDSKGAIFSQGALGMVMANEAEVTRDEDHSLRAEEIGIFQEWGEGELVDNWGVEVYSDTAATV
jgi:hypothetical protein|tara:strand:+ start:886 stop:1785 length:900 start_codon:yes stop_codon:yes gene_type:complete